MFTFSQNRGDRSGGGDQKVNMVPTPRNYSWNGYNMYMSNYKVIPVNQSNSLIDSWEPPLVKDPVLSILLRYSGGRLDYLEQSVASILDDNNDINLELIIVDDGSNRCSNSTTFPVDDRVGVLRLRDQLGASEARRQGIAVSRGQYLRLHDYDDVLVPGCLGRQLGFMSRHGYKVSLTDYLDYDGINATKPEWEGWHIHWDQNADTLYEVINSFETWLFAGATVMWSRELESICAPIDTLNSEDLYWFRGIMSQIGSKDIGFYPEATLWYRMCETSISKGEELESDFYQQAFVSRSRSFVISATSHELMSITIATNDEVVRQGLGGFSNVEFSSLGNRDKCDVVFVTNIKDIDPERLCILRISPDKVTDQLLLSLPEQTYVLINYWPINYGRQSDKIILNCIGNESRSLIRPYGVDLVEKLYVSDAMAYAYQVDLETLSTIVDVELDKDQECNCRYVLSSPAEDLLGFYAVLQRGQIPITIRDYRYNDWVLGQLKLPLSSGRVEEIRDAVEYASSNTQLYTYWRRWGRLTGGASINGYYLLRVIEGLLHGNPIIANRRGSMVFGDSDALPAAKPTLNGVIYREGYLESGESGDPLITFVVRCYNSRADYLDRCLESIRNQGYERNEFEILVVDDGSKEAVEVTGVNLVRLPWNHGTMGARLAGIKYATGKYVRFVDCDDELIEGSIKPMVSYMEAKGLLFCVTPALVNGVEVDMCNCRDKTVKDSIVGNKFEIGYCGASAIFRKEVSCEPESGVGNKKGYPYEFLPIDDDTWGKYVVARLASDKVGHWDKPTYRYEVESETSISHGGKGIDKRMYSDYVIRYDYDSSNEYLDTYLEEIRGRSRRKLVYIVERGTELDILRPHIKALNRELFDVEVISDSNIGTHLDTDNCLATYWYGENAREIGGVPTYSCNGNNGTIKLHPFFGVDMGEYRKYANHREWIRNKLGYNSDDIVIGCKGILARGRVNDGKVNGREVRYLDVDVLRAKRQHYAHLLAGVDVVAETCDNSVWDALPAIAGALGVPLISSSINSLDYIINGYTGVYNSNYSEVLSDFISWDKNKRKAFGDFGRAVATSRYNISKVTRGYELTYMKVVDDYFETSITGNIARFNKLVKLGTNRAR